MKYESRPYRCPTCGHEEMVGTNHQGEIYSSCPKCKAGVRYCTEARTEGREYVHALMYKYRFDLSCKLWRPCYETLVGTLTADGRQRHRVLSHHETAVAELAHAHGMFLRAYKPLQWPDQFVTNVGRLHLWKEYAWPNEDIREGYFLVLKDHGGTE